MPIVTRRELNNAKKIYRSIRFKLKEFDYGPYSFETKFLQWEEKGKMAFYISKSFDFELSELAAARVRVLLRSSPENIRTLLKAVEARYGVIADNQEDQE